MYFLFSSGVAVVNDVVGATGGAVFPGPAASERWLLSTQVQIALCGRVLVTFKANCIEQPGKTTTAGAHRLGALTQSSLTVSPCTQPDSCSAQGDPVCLSSPAHYWPG